MSGHVSVWERFLDSLDTPGGNIAVLLCLVLLGVMMVYLGMSKGEDLLIGSFGALIGVLRGQITNHRTRQNGSQQNGGTP